MATRELLKGIVSDDSQNTEFLYDMTPEQWHRGVKQALDLLAEPPCTTSKAILDAIAASGKRGSIIPAKQRAATVEGGKEYGNAGALATDSQRAAAPGRPTEDDPPLVGVGGGSDSVLQFVAQDWEPAGSGASFKAVDEVLLHELVHSLRQMQGQEDNTELVAPWTVSRLAKGSTVDPGPPPTALTQVYDNLEEFAAILITNIYRSENVRVGLVRDHLGARPRRGEPADTPKRPFRDPKERTRELGYPLTNPRNFLTMWRPQITRLFDELSVNATIQKIQGVRCGFNPFFELLLERTKPVSAWAHRAHRGPHVPSARATAFPVRARCVSSSRSLAIR